MNSTVLAKAFSSFILANTALCLNLLLVEKSRLYVIKAEKKQKKEATATMFRCGGFRYVLYRSFFKAGAVCYY
ncbi:hypothetical protein [Prevotella intermedia]|uniref:Uncharacterized protein n=1 Tax=Prevotella intermedia TaxID=28131 RepID=A0A2A6EER4_PREIN|nr:hypothetical protein [Prevotella intermedia]PDP60016.1 hypothetical protein CLI71_07750 [Prevotella intermedia]